MSKNRKRCWQPGCTETDTIKCEVSYSDDGGEWKTETFRYCHDHAQENGFCYCCGIFSAGIESFDFMHPGLCDNCHDQIEADVWDDSEMVNAEDYYFENSEYPY